MGVLITVVIIALLLLSGPANAFDLQLGTPSDTTPTQGDEITFTATAEVLANEIVPIQNLSLDFSGGRVCYFSVDGDLLTDCTGITITQSEDSTNHTTGVLNFTAAGQNESYGSGFGYGYAAPGPSKLAYDVTLDTGEFGTGSLSYTLNAHMKGDTYTSDEESITIGRHRSNRGGGSSIPPNPSNTLTWTQMTPGAATITKITNEDLGLTQIIIEVNNPTQNVKIVIEKLAGKPATITKTINGKVFKYLQITKQNLDDTNLKGNVKVQFKVPYSWLLGNGVDPKNIALKRFANNDWQDLMTNLLSTDSRYAYFEAETPGFSFFAIGEKNVAAALTPVPKAEELITPTPTGEVVKEETEQAKPETKPPVTTTTTKKPTTTTTTKAKPNTGVQVAIVVIVVIAMGLIILTSTGRKRGLKPIREIKG
jgi:PGF-pre-PGF domain-containing protein